MGPCLKEQQRRKARWKCTPVLSRVQVWVRIKRRMSPSLVSMHSKFGADLGLHGAPSQVRKSTRQSKTLSKQSPSLQRRLGSISGIMYTARALCHIIGLVSASQARAMAIAHFYELTFSVPAPLIARFQFSSGSRNANNKLFFLFHG